MAGAPKYKVYDNDGNYMASCKEAGDAAILVSVGYPDRGTVRLYHSKTLYTSGIGEVADESYDAIAEMILRRENAVHQKAYDAPCRATGHVLVGASPLVTEEGR